VDPVGGGPIEGVKQLSASADRAGHRVEVCSLDSANAPCVQDFCLPLHPLGPSLGKYGYSRRFTSFLKENAANYDVVVVNGIWQYHSFATWQILRKTATPYVVFTHGMLDPWFKRTYPLKHAKKWLYWPWVEYRVLRDAAAVLFTTEEERREASRSFWLYRANELVVNLGTERAPADHPQQLAAFQARFPQLKGKRIALFLSRIHPKKGCDLLIRSFASVLAKDPDWHLVLAGPDQVGWQFALQDLANRLDISDRITWTGMLSGNLKWGAFRTSEVFCLPSHQENFGIAVAEALSCGVPVLISNKVNIWREVHECGAGLVEPDSVEGSTSLFRRWLNLSDAQMLAMRERAALCFNRSFEIEAARRSLYSVLESVVKRRAENLV
jgi:glycosyltransferase involved in cell wall biosynthesis